MKKYSDYIIALDLDETLLDSNGQISETTLKTLLKCKELGFNIAISSTRGYGTCTKFAEAISADYVCCQAGNMIVDKDKNIIYEHPFSKKELSDFIDHFSKYTNDFIIDSDSYLYGGLDDDFAHSWGVIYKNTEEVKHERFNRMRDILDAGMADNNKKYEGRIEKVLVEGSSKTNIKTLTGRTESMKIVNFYGSRDMIGKIVEVRITEGKTYSLVGEVI